MIQQKLQQFNVHMLLTDDLKWPPQRQVTLSGPHWPPVVTRPTGRTQQNLHQWPGHLRRVVLEGHRHGGDNAESGRVAPVLAEREGVGRDVGGDVGSCSA